MSLKANIWAYEVIITLYHHLTLKLNLKYFFLDLIDEILPQEVFEGAESESDVRFPEILIRTRFPVSNRIGYPIKIFFSESIFQSKKLIWFIPDKNPISGYADSFRKTGSDVQ